MSKIRALAPAEENKKFNKDITTKQWIVYYYLLSISKWNAKDREDHYYFYTKDLNISKISSFLGMSRSTFYLAFDKLFHKKIIYDNPYDKDRYIPSDEKVKIKETSVFYIRIPKIYAELERNLLTFLLGYQKFVGIDLVRTYVILKKSHDCSDRKKFSFTRRYIVGLLGHNKNDTNAFKQVELYLGMLSYWGLIKLIKTKERDEQIGEYTKFILDGINDNIPDSMENDVNAPVDEELFNKVKKELEADPTWNLGNKNV